MKKYVYSLICCLWTMCGFAQLNKRDLPVVYLPNNVSVHFVSPEPIRYVDISIKNVVGDLPVPTILRIKQRDTIGSCDAVVTITCETYIAQYHVVFCDADKDGTIQTEIPVLPQDMKLLDHSELSQPELRQAALRLLAQKPERHLEKTKAVGLTAQLYHVYTVGGYVFLDLGYRNDTRLRYDIDQLRFSIEDQKVTKASTVQSVALTPTLVLQEIGSFDKHYRNIFVFKKLSYPGNKRLSIELSEKQISGRVITLKVGYKDLLGADSLP
jgi:conjugative transposon TraN protein